MPQSINFFEYVDRYRYGSKSLSFQLPLPISFHPFESAGSRLDLLYRPTIEKHEINKNFGKNQNYLRNSC